MHAPPPPMLTTRFLRYHPCATHRPCCRPHRVFGVIIFFLMLYGLIFA